jgi:hypothetical protein
MITSHTIDADNKTRAPMTAADYMAEAVRNIDLHFGDGYAEKHPELVGAFMQTAAIDLGTAIIARALESVTTIFGAKS